MAVLKSADGNEMIISCSCRCEEGIHLMIDRDDEAGIYLCATYLSGSFYKEQENRVLKKLCKIWAIVRNKDYYYSEICMDKAQFQEMKDFINQF